MRDCFTLTTREEPTTGGYGFEATKKILVYVHETDYAGFVRSGYTHMGKGAVEGGHIQMTSALTRG